MIPPLPPKVTLLRSLLSFSLLWLLILPLILYNLLAPLTNPNYLGLLVRDLDLRSICSMLSRLTGTVKRNTLS